MTWKPRNALTLDAVGATATSLVTYFVLASQWLPTGLPSRFLVFMAGVAAGFAVFDLVALALGWVSALRVIAVANLLYGLTMIAALVSHWAEATPIGMASVVGEAAILAALSRWEWQVSRSGL